MNIWRDYNSAKIFIKTLKLRTSRDYNKYIKPIDIPKRVIKNIDKRDFHHL